MNRSAKRLLNLDDFNFVSTIYHIIKSFIPVSNAGVCIGGACGKVAGKPEDYK